MRGVGARVVGLFTHQVDDWGPLCEFLDKPLPDKQFPAANSSIAKLREVCKYYARRLGRVPKT